MRAAVHLAICLCLWTTGAAADRARLEVFVQDAAMMDVVVLRNAEGCGPVSGQLRVDFGPSAGQVVIDTEYGGGGTQDPWPPVVRMGPARLLPVADGARAIEMLVAGLQPGDQVVVTLDIDNERGATRATRIVATGEDVAGSVAVFTPEGSGEGALSASFDASGAAILEGSLPCRPLEMF